MRGALVLLIALAAGPLAAESVALPVQQRVAAALAAEVSARLGPEASVSVRSIDVALRGQPGDSLVVVPGPQARLGESIPFTVIGTGANGRPRQIGRGHAELVVSVRHARVVRTILHGTVLGAGDVADASGQPGTVSIRRLPTAHDLVGATTRRDVGSGEVLTGQDVVMPAAIRAGDTVQAHATVGSVVVVAQLTALDAGAEGAVVRVVNRDTRREVRARVIRAGVVEVIHE